MVQFRLVSSQQGRIGETCMMRVSAMMCLFPAHRQIRTIEHGWTVTVCEEDWLKVEKMFRYAYLGNEVRASGSET